jgi:thiol-disulfide isomerase/thioredoxin
MLAAACGPLRPDGKEPEERLPTVDAGRVWAILVNGGGSPASNYQSHLLHVRLLTEFLVHTGVPPAHITIFSADGADPEPDLAVREVQPETDFWMLRGTRVQQALRTQVRYEDSVVDGFTLQPASPAALGAWFESTGPRLGPGDTLLLYVTDHGTKNEEDATNNRITLWGKREDGKTDESLSVTELDALLARLAPGVRVVTLMSQCFSGAFANTMYGRRTDHLPTGNVCGFFSSTADRPAYGCYPENRDKDNVGHSFRFIDSLKAGYSFPASHDGVMVTDRTPDVPLRTSDIFLDDVLREVAAERGGTQAELVDGLLRVAWRDKGAWEPEIRLLDRIGRAFGYFSPRSVAELTEQSKLLPQISDQFQSYSAAWKATLNSLAEENLQRFLAATPSWAARLDAGSLTKLDAPGRRALTAELLAELTAHTRLDPTTNARLELLRTKADNTTAARYRMQVRLGVVLRMQAVLTSIAGRTYLATEGTVAQRQAYDALRECEMLALGDAAMPWSTPVVPEPFPSYDEELELAKANLPGWMGIRFKQANPGLRERFGLEPGAVAVVTVYPDSPALEAGFEVGDIVVGPPGQPFREQAQIREWVMLAPIGRPADIDVLRDAERLRLTLVPDSYPLAWPALPGPPKVGTKAPPLDRLVPYRGTLPSRLAEGGPVLLFFWATWCAPCKASLPEVMAFQRERGVPVIAITDELPELLDGFFASHDDPFPEIVAIDEYRRSFLAYGVSGTPAFVLTDASGRVASYAVGYRPDRGLEFEGWAWSRKGR